MACALQTMTFLSLNSVVSEKKTLRNI